MSILKKLAGQTVVYGLSSIVGRFLNYMLVPLHTKLFLPSEYGVITDMYAIIAFLNVVYTYGMETAYFRFATKENGNEQAAFSNAFLSICGSTLLLSGGIFWMAPEIASVLGHPDRIEIVRWTSAILAIDALVAIPFARLRLQKKVYLFAGARISGIVLNILLNIFFLLLLPFVVKEGFFEALLPLTWWVYTDGWTIEYVFLANLLSNLIFFPFLLPTLRQLSMRIHPGEWKQMLIYAFPILLMGVAGTINEMFSRIMLKQWLPEGFYPGTSNMAALGIFGACYKLSVFMTLTIQAFRYASEPFFFSSAQDKNAPDLFARVMTYFVWVCGAIFVLVSINMDWLADIFIKNDAYKEGLVIVPILLMANVWMGIYFNLSVWYKLTDKTFWGTYITLAGAIITIIANYYFIPVAGYMGSVWSTWACYASMALASYLLGQKYYPVPYPLGWILAMMAGCSALVWSLIAWGQGYSLLLKNTLAVVWVACMYAGTWFVYRSKNPSPDR